MTTSELLLTAKALLSSGEAKPVIESMIPALEALQLASSSDLNALVNALLILDAAVPHPWTFLLWVDEPGRTKSEVLRVIGTAAQRASRAEAE